MFPKCARGRFKYKGTYWETIFPSDSNRSSNRHISRATSRILSSIWIHVTLDQSVAREYW